MAEETTVEENAEVNQDQQGDAAQGDTPQEDTAQSDTAQGDAPQGEAAQEDTSQGDASQTDSKTQAQSVEFSEAADTGAVGSGGSIDILLDMGVLITVAIGKTEIPVRRLLQLGPGSVLKLDKSIDAPVDLYLRDTRFAAGNVVVVDGRFAVRIEKILGLGEAEAQVSEAQSDGA
ncbi:MAG: FliM/FliN family flagellar motor switch protein [Planctomycetota bacterium]|jgi:flagellar motor switch protein FliN/FliY